MANVDVSSIERKAELLTHLIAWSDLGPIFPVWGILEATGVCQCPDGAACVNPGKHPIGFLVPNGWHDASVDGATLHGWASSEYGEACNWALVCGTEREGRVLVALDVDPRNDGDATLRALESELGHLPETLCVNTGGGGQHYFAWVLAGVKLRASAGDGIEVKRQGSGYVVLAGSRHVSGRTYCIDVGCNAAGARSGRDLLAAIALLPDRWVGRLSGEDEHTAEIVPIGPASQSPLARGFELAGWLGKSFGTGRVVPARCPWLEEHTPLKNGHRTGDGGDTSCVLLPAMPRNAMGGFRCMHAHCSGRGVSAAWAMLPEHCKARVREEFPEAFTGKKKKRAAEEPPPSAPSLPAVAPMLLAPPYDVRSWPPGVQTDLDRQFAEMQRNAGNGEGRAQRILDRGTDRKKSPHSLHAGWYAPNERHTRPLTDDELARLALHVRWTEKTLVKTVSNLANYLAWDPRFWTGGRPCVFKHGRSGEVCFQNAPWDRTKRAGWRAPNNYDAGGLCMYLETAHHITVSHDAANQIIQDAAEIHTFDPLVENMTRLGASWDGMPRLDKLIGLEGSGSLIECDKGDPEYLRLVGRYWMISLAKRCIEPGAQADAMLMLTGTYGVGKTSFFRALGDALHEASEREDSGIFVNIHLDNKVDEIEARIADAALVLIDELSGVNKQTVNAFKSLLTTTQATFRRTYARHKESVKRAAVFCGTGNMESVAYDKETLRRMWPVNVSKLIDNKRVEAESRQLLAEAVTCAMAGEVYWPNTHAINQLFYAKRRGFIAMNDGASTYIQDAIRDVIGEGMAGDRIPKVSVVMDGQVYVNFEGLCDYIRERAGMLHPVHNLLVASSLQSAGFTKIRLQKKTGDVSGRVWGRPLDGGTLPGRGFGGASGGRQGSPGPEDGAGGDV